MSQVSRFLIDHPCFNYADDFSAICAPLTALGINYFSHVRVFDNQEFACFAKSSKFLAYYVNQGYFNFDAHRIEPSAQEQYMLWDVVEKQDQTLAMHQDFNNHGFGHTFTIMNRGDSFTDFYNFAAPFGEDSINSRYFSNLEFLKGFIAYFTDKVQAHKSLRQAYQITLSYCEKQQGGYLTSTQQIDNYSDLIPTKSLEKIHIPGTANYLSKREFECLHWVALGKTQDQVGDILAISARTVKAHLNNIKEKLNCFNQFQLGMHYASIKSQLGIS